MLSSKPTRIEPNEFFLMELKVFVTKKEKLSVNVASNFVLINHSSDSVATAQRRTITYPMYVGKIRIALAKHHFKRRKTKFSIFISEIVRPPYVRSKTNKIGSLYSTYNFLSSICKVCGYERNVAVLV